MCKLFCDGICNTCEVCMYDVTEKVLSKEHSDKPPMYKDTKLRISKLPRDEREKYWSKIKPVNSFKNIKPNTWYHVPPIDGDKRMDIYVTQKYVYSFSYKKKNDDPNIEYFVYETDLTPNFMTEIKNEN